MEREVRTVAGEPRVVPVPRSARVLAGRYRVIALLGAGGMGSVFLAKDLELDELVAVKMLHGQLSDEHALAQFRSEVRLARRVTHTNVARTFDIGEHEGERFLTMEYIEGESLGALLDREGSLDLAYFFRVAEATVAGLAAAHEAGVVHRDLKPGNILVGPARSGRIVLTDFGIAAPSEEKDDAAFVGTPSYMAPEQFDGHADARSDVYSLGLVMFRALTGQRAFDTSHPLQREADPPRASARRPDLPEGLCPLITKCLELEPQKRFPSASEVRDALEEIVATVSDEPAPPTVITPVAHSSLREVQLEPRTIFVSTTAEDPFATGLRDAIVDRLNEHPILRATRDGDSEHEVSAVLEMPRGPDGARLSVRLVGSREGFEFWSESFEASESETMGLASTAAHEIERALAVRVTDSQDIPPLGKAGVELYLAGRAELRKFWPARLQLAAEAFSAAIELAPGHPLLLAALASARVRQRFFEDCSEEDARAAADRALSAAPHLAEAHVARAMLHNQDNESCEALSEILRALELAPGLADAHDVLAYLLLDAGAPASAVRACEIALRRDPSMSSPRWGIARAHALYGRWDQAAAMLDATSADVAMLTDAYRIRFALWRRDRITVAATLRKEGPQNDQTRAFRYLCEGALAGNLYDAETTLRAGKPAGPSARRSLTFANQVGAELATFVGDHTRALAALERAVASGLPDTAWLDRCPLFDELRGLRKFESLREIVQARAKEVLLRFEGTPASEAVSVR